MFVCTSLYCVTLWTVLASVCVLMLCDVLCLVFIHIVVVITPPRDGVSTEGRCISVARQFTAEFTDSSQQCG